MRYCNSALHSKKFREINAKLFSRNSWFFSLWAFSRIWYTKLQINLHENFSLDFHLLGQFLLIKGDSLCFDVKIQRSNRFLEEAHYSDWTRIDLGRAVFLFFFRRFPRHLWLSPIKYVAVRVSCNFLFL